MAENKTLIVDAGNSGDYTTITEAIAAARPGARIQIRPGVYKEGLVIDKPLEIVGEGEPGEVVLQAAGQDVILFNAESGLVANLVLQQMGRGEWYGVDITQGRLELTSCNISSKSLACIGIHEGAAPIIRRCRIHDSRQGGISIYENGHGILEENDIFDNAYFGIEICEGSDPVLRRNKIYDNKQSGVFIYDKGKGTLEDNEIFGNGYSGVEIRGDSSPTLRRNKIYDNRQNGVLFAVNGRGILEDNEVTDNTYAGVEVRDGATPTLLHNHIHRNAYAAIWVHDGGGGIMEENDLQDSPHGAWDIAPDCEKNVKRAGNYGS